MNQRAIKADKKAHVSFRINPDVDAKTHAKISTGKKENKFGISYERARAVYARAATLEGIQVSGIDMHIGSQITDLQPFEDAFRLLRELVETLRGDGHTIDHVDVGGGLGIPYKDDNNPPPEPDAYARIVKLLGGYKGNKSPLKPSFYLDASRPGTILFDEGVTPPERPVAPIAAE